jgi:serine phosphatase RsbU (regulator of sigma subunit)|tara:strand:- start:2385 stop:2858 length:474 start_codon:yes stop_codon:yes gene_type:complete
LSEDIDDQIKMVTGHVSRMSWGARFAAVGVISGMCGTLYAGFLMYQKVEEIANLDLEAYQKQMEIMDTKVTEAVDYSRDIKNGLRDDIIRIEQQVDRIEDIANGIENDTRDMIDRAEERFENRREQLRSSQDQDMKELEERLSAKLQRALDNPLSDQ